MGKKKVWKARKKKIGCYTVERTGDGNLWIGNTIFRPLQALRLFQFLMADYN